jgi:hypothetical protein
MDAGQVGERWENIVKLAARCGSVLAGAALIAGVIPATSASAAPRVERYCMGIVHEAPFYWVTEGCFIPNGDDITAEDSYADGLGSVTEWKTDYGRSDECYNGSGAGWTITCYYDMRETERVKIRSCTRRGVNASNTKCTSWSPWLSISTGNPA